VSDFSKVYFMQIIQELLSTLPTEPVAVQNVVIGLHWTLVCSKTCGLASTLTTEGPHGHSKIQGSGALHHKSAQELAQWALSDNMLEASVGMAAINSLIEIDEDQFIDLNAADVIADKANDKNLVVIGHFPFVDRIRTLAHNCWVIEKKPYGDDFPEEAAAEFIPQADVVAITGTALINHSMEKLLSFCQPKSLVLVLGPSTPLSSILFNYGVHILSGARINDKQAAILTIQQGASLPQVQGVRLVTMSKPNRSHL
jgi:uncharacterized protein (DUF4213/DUF364 family)